MKKANAVFGERRQEFSRQQAYCCSTMCRTRRCTARNVSVAVRPSMLRSTTSLSICCFEPGDAHFKKFVEVGADDAEEFHAVRAAGFRIQRLIQHALVEFQPAQLAIDEMLRTKLCRFPCHSEDGNLARDDAEDELQMEAEN